VYATFVADAYSRMILGWQISRSLRAGLNLDALEVALWRCQLEDLDGLVHYSDCGVQFLFMRYTGTWPKLAPSLLAAPVAIRMITLWSSGLYKTELIRKQGPWRALEDVEFATLDWVDWFNNRRLREPIGHVPLQGKVNFSVGDHCRLQSERQLPPGTPPHTVGPPRRETIGAGPFRALAHQAVHGAQRLPVPRRCL